jgi:hypothetical protein
MFDNFYFLNTPLEIQEECYETIFDKLNKLELTDKNYVYLIFSPINNIGGNIVLKYI